MIPGFRPGVCLSTAGRSCFPDRHFPRHFADFGNAPRRVEKAEQEIPLESCSAGHELCNVTFRWNVFHSLHCGERLSLARNIDRNVSGPGDPHVRQAGIRGPRLCRRRHGFDSAPFRAGAGSGHPSVRTCGEGTRQGRRLCRGFRLHHRTAADAGRSA